MAARSGQFSHTIADMEFVGKKCLFSFKKAIREMFTTEFSMADMTCVPEHIFEDGDWAILEWKNTLGL